MTRNPLDYRVTIRDYGFVTGGGHAVVHSSTCAGLDTSAPTVQAASRFDRVSDFRYEPNRTPSEAIADFRAKWTVYVPFTRLRVHPQPGRARGVTMDWTILAGIGVAAAMSAGLLLALAGFTLGWREYRAQNPPEVVPYRDSDAQRRLRDPEATQRLPVVVRDEQ